MRRVSYRAMIFVLSLALTGLAASWAIGQGAAGLTSIQPVVSNGLLPLNERVAIGGRIFSNAVFSLIGDGSSTATWDLGRKFDRFEAWIGISDGEDVPNYAPPPPSASAVFTVSVDGARLYESPAMSKGNPPVQVRVSVSNARAITLAVQQSGFGYGPGFPRLRFSLWAEPTLIRLPKVGGGARIFVNGAPLDATAITREGVTYLPLRAVAEALGAVVQYDKLTNTIQITTRR